MKNKKENNIVLARVGVGMSARQRAECLEELKGYRAIGTRQSAVKKQKAKKPIRNDKCTCPLMRNLY